MVSKSSLFVSVCLLLVATSSLAHALSLERRSLKTPALTGRNLAQQDGPAIVKPNEGNDYDDYAGNEADYTEDQQATDDDYKNEEVDYVAEGDYEEDTADNTPTNNNDDDDGKNSGDDGNKNDNNNNDNGDNDKDGNGNNSNDNDVVDNSGDDDGDEEEYEYIAEGSNNEEEDYDDSNIATTGPVATIVPALAPRPIVLAPTPAVVLAPVPAPAIVPAPVPAPTVAVAQIPAPAPGPEPAFVTSSATMSTVGLALMANACLAVLML